MNNRNFSKAQEAVSPVVATLLLVLVAAGSAIGFGVFLNGFQKDTQENVNTDIGGQVLRIDGSSTVYEYTIQAAPGFEALYGFKVQATHDGSGVGRQAAGQCLTDIGASSSPFTSPELAKWPDCDGDGKKDIGRELVIVKVATDAVVPVTLATNSHCTGTISLTKNNMREIYGKYAANTAGASFDPVKFGTPALADLTTLTADAITKVTWADLHGINGNVCTGPNAGNEIKVFDRSDKGGTSEIAAKSLLGGGQSQLEDIGITLPSSLQGDGNQGVLAGVNAHASKNDILFFSSFGYAVDNGLKLSAFGNVNAPVVPSAGNIKTGTFEATRPILYAALGTGPAISDIINPTARAYIDYVLNPNNNIKFADATSFVSLYA